MKYWIHHLVGTAFLLLFVRMTGYGQDATVVTPSAYTDTLNNYIRTWTSVTPDTADADFTTACSLLAIRMTTQYFDGLGKILQTIFKQGSYPTGGTAVDLVTAEVYDNYDRQPRIYLSFAANSTGGNSSISDGFFKTNPFQQQNYFYCDANANSPINSQGETYYYSKTEYEASPLNRSSANYGAGDNWVHAGHGLTYTYDINTAADSVEVIRVTDTTLGLFGRYTGVGRYLAGDLTKLITTNENGKQVIEFQDKQNRTILKKVQMTASNDNGSGCGHGGWLCTYYVYDYKSQLRAVIQPSGVAALIAGDWSFTTTILNEQLFRYEYDTRARMILKKVPGAAVVYTIYDDRDLPVMSQDSNLRAQNKWHCTLYDALDRPVMTALITYSGTWGQLQDTVKGRTNSFSTSSVSVSGQSASIAPTSLTLNSSETGDWYASSYIDLAQGFSASPGVEFSAQIANGGSIMQSGGSVQISDNPLPSGTTPDILTVTYYDNYNWVSGNALGAGFQMPVTSGFITTYNASPDYAQPLVSTSQTTGLVTGTMTRVLGTTTQYLYSISFYDDHDRVIQTRQVNYTGQTDQLTTQYRFAGNPLRVYLEHAKAGPASASATDIHTAMTRISYDAEQRESAIYKNIDGAPGDQLIDSMTYDALGQLRTTLLGKDPVTGNPLDSLVYDRNIRGWILGINRNYVGGTAQHYFGMELGYDKTTSISGGTYTAATFNGNIAGVVWKSAADAVNRKYDFTYDAANRLQRAAYTDNESGSWNTSKMDYSDSALTYDANGNILSMIQKGFKVGNPQSIIDSLTYRYEYSNGSNKLTRVYDQQNDSTSLLGDFHWKGTKSVSDSDYVYDGNGNLLKDKNKQIDTIIYNYLNLPQQIHVHGKGNIFYTYDAAGNKLQKQTVDSLSGLATTTLYMAGGFQYQRRTPNNNLSSGTDTLLFLGHEEGRARWAAHQDSAGNGSYSWQYDFMERDHLGNTRVLLTQERDTAYYIATMEPQYRATEDALFYKIDSTSYAANQVPNGGFPAEPKGPSPNDSVAKVDGAGHEIGPSIVLKVMAGDSLVIGCYGYYASGGSLNSPNNSFTNVLNSLATALYSLTGGTHGTTSAMTNASTGPVYSAVNSFLPSSDTNTTSRPKAYLNWMLLDNQLNYVSSNNQSGAIPIGQPNILNTLATNIKLKHSGFLYIWVSDETPNWPVFFDNLSVEDFSGPLLEENHYYPFGLSMSGISDRAIKQNYAENKYRFNKGSELQNKEFSDGSGLEIYATNYRGLDPQLGRFWQIDPFADVNEDVSTYSFAGNDPILLNDPFGLLSDSSKPQQLPTAIVNGHKNSTTTSSTAILTIYTVRPIVDGVGVGVRPPLVPKGTFMSGAAANVGFKQPPYPNNSIVREYKLTRSERFVRVSNSKTSGRTGGWVVKEESIRGMNSKEIQNNLALENEPDQIGEVELPEGTVLRAGPVGGNAWGAGNVKIEQYQIMSRVPNGAFKPPTPLPTSSGVPLTELMPIEAPIDEIDPDVDIP